MPKRTLKFHRHCGEYAHKDGVSKIFHPVLPTEGNIKEGGISVKNTAGAYLGGLVVDDTIQIGIPSDFRSLKITKAVQSYQL